MKTPKQKLAFRRIRIRKKISGTDVCPRLSVYLGHKHVYAQLINDDKGYTLVFASTLSPELKGKLKGTDTIPAAKAVGELIGQKAVQKGIKKVVFDRGGRIYTGRVKALADAARQAGLEF